MFSVAMGAFAVKREGKHSSFRENESLLIIAGFMVFSIDNKGTLCTNNDTLSPFLHA